MADISTFNKFLYIIVLAMALVVVFSQQRKIELLEKELNNQDYWNHKMLDALKFKSAQLDSAEQALQEKFLYKYQP